MAHRHTIGVQFTGPDIEDGDDHYHSLPGGGKTSTNPEGPRHTHTAPGGQKTSGPVPLSKDGTEARHHNMKKKKKKKKGY